MNMKKLLAVALIATLTGCNDAQVASSNISKASDMFEVDRRIVFYNGITNDYILTISGKCSIESNSHKLAVTCKTGVGQYKKHYLGISDNVTYFVEQLDSIGIDVYHYRVIFKPSIIIPDIDVKL